MANLWDVTDRDVDRFSRALLDRWDLHPDTDDEGGNLEAGANVAGGGEGPVGVPRPLVCLAGSVAASRGACRLPHLIGAAPVCYGIPVHVTATRSLQDKG